MLKVGDAAPPIDAMGSDGKRFVLHEQTGLCTVIYFFPKAFTPQCTAETKEFRKHYVEVELAGAALVGVSTDDRDTQCRFAGEMGAPFPLLGDHDLAVSRAYDVLWPLIGIAHRVTYIVAPVTSALSAAPATSGAGGKPAWTVEAVFRHELDVGAHRDEVLRFVNEKFQRARPAPVRK